MNTRRVRHLLKGALHSLDALITTLQLASGVERAGIVALLFHHVFSDEAEIAQDVVLPQERITVSQYRQIIQYFLNAGYRFVTPDDVERGCQRNERLVMLTLDDGYANNLRILPLLSEFQIPATIFVATDYIVNQRVYWWDVVYRNRVRQGAMPAMIRAEMEPLMQASRAEVEIYLDREFGPRALTPLTDLDRPLTVEELRAIAAEPLICIGSHTSSHRRLSRLREEDIEAELAGSRAAISQITGSAPRSLSYPYGDYSAEVMRVAARVGFQVGVTCVPVKLPLPVSLGTAQSLQIGRCQIMGNQAVAAQCAQARSDVSALKALQRRRLMAF